jgi:hypothetical protein
MATHQFISQAIQLPLHSTNVCKLKPFSAAC